MNQQDFFEDLKLTRVTSDNFDVTFEGGTDEKLAHFENMLGVEVPSFPLSPKKSDRAEYITKLRSLFYHENACSVDDKKVCAPEKIKKTKTKSKNKCGSKLGGATDEKQIVEKQIDEKDTFNILDDSVTDNNEDNVLPIDEIDDITRNKITIEGNNEDKIVEVIVEDKIVDKVVEVIVEDKIVEDKIIEDIVEDKITENIVEDIVEDKIIENVVEDKIDNEVILNEKTEMVVDKVAEETEDVAEKTEEVAENIEVVAEKIEVEDIKTDKIEELADGRLTKTELIDNIKQDMSDITNKLMDIYQNNAEKPEVEKTGGDFTLDDFLQ